MGHSIQSALSQSVHRVLVTLVNFLPGLLALLLAVMVLAMVGIALAALTRRLLTSLRFDERLAASQAPGALTSVADWSPANSPTQLAARAVWWICLLAGIVVGLTAFNASISGSNQISLLVLPYVTHIVGAVLLLIAGTLLARFLSRSVLIGAVNAQLQYARFLSLGIKWLVLVLTGAMALDHLQIAGGIVELAFGILFGGIVLTLSLAVGLGSRELVSRSIEKTIERPAPGIGPTAVPPARREGEPPQSPLRHF
jgi:hypothetical protein